MRERIQIHRHAENSQDLDSSAAPFVFSFKPDEDHNFSASPHFSSSQSLNQESTGLKAGSWQPPQRFAGLPSPGRILRNPESSVQSNLPNRIQAKLRVSNPQDAEEQEADRNAEAIAKIPDSPMPGSQSNRFPQRASTDGKKTTLEVSRSASSPSGLAVDPGVAQRLHQTQGGGSALDPETRAFMEPRFGADFSQVRIHQDSEAAQLNRSLQAEAFTHGQDIYFGTSKYDTQSEEGKRLLAHELTHVVQQRPETAEIQRKEAEEISKMPDKNEAGADFTSGTETLGGNVYTVQEGDSLWRIAQTIYGDGNYWSAIVQANLSQVGGSDLLFVGTQLELPAIQMPKKSLDSNLNSNNLEPNAQQSSPYSQLPDESTALAQDQKLSQADQGNQASQGKTVESEESLEAIAPGVQNSRQLGTSAKSQAQNQGGGHSPAVNCLMPALRHNLQGERIELDPITTPGGTFKFFLELDGEMVLQKQGMCNPLKLDQANYITEFYRFINEYKQNLSLAQVSPSQAALNSSLSGNFTASGAQYHPPTRWSYQAPLNELKATAQGWMVGGKLGYTLQVELIPNPGATTPNLAVDGEGNLGENQPATGPERFQQILEEDTPYLRGSRTRGISSTGKVPYLLMNQVPGFKFAETAARFSIAAQTLKLKLKFARR